MSFTADWDKTILEMKYALEEAVREVLDVAKEHIQEFAPVGTPGNTTNPPGDLKDSVEIEGPVTNGEIWEGSVGPTAVSMYDEVTEYGHFRDVGGDLFAHGAEPMKFVIDGNWFSRYTVHQEGAHYMEEAYFLTEPEVTEICERHMTEVTEQP
jgi:hypothetical protein